MRSLGCILLLLWSSLGLAQAFSLWKGKASRLEGASLWSNGEFALNITELPEDSGRLGWAILHLGPTAALHGLQSSAIFAAIPSTASASVLLVPIETVSELDKLAPLAHSETGSCGSLEFLPRSYRLAAALPFVAPIYNSRANFAEIPAILQQVDTTVIRATIQNYHANISRYHNHPVGKTFANTLAADWQNLGVSTARANIQTLAHTASPQSSVIARLEGTSKAQETVILGAHLDSISVRNGGTLAGSAPGADDNASGLAILKEILRVVETLGLRFERSIEWHAYAAEEVGLVGSREIAKSYRDQQRIIAGMLQFDMAAYSASQDAEGLLYFLDDFTSIDVQRQAAEWVRRYLGPFVRYGRMPTGSASDHKAWWEQGYSTLFAFEDPNNYNPYIHSPLDTDAAFDGNQRLTHMTKLGLLFLIHYAGLVDLAPSYAEQLATLLPEPNEAKLYLAIAPSEESAAYFVSVSAPLEAETLEFCQITEGSSIACLEERQRLSKSTTIEDRKVFYESKTFPLLLNQKWRLFAYDSQGQLISWRQIQFESSGEP